MNDLLTPRFEVIAGYPNMFMYIGAILTHDNTAKAWLFYEKDRPVFCGVQNPEKYPNIFKKLEWWEYRTEEEMPKYVKIQNDTEIVKIEKWDMKTMFGIEKINGTLREGCDLLLWKNKPEQYQPATEEEYNSYINSL